MMPQLSLTYPSSLSNALSTAATCLVLLWSFCRPPSCLPSVFPSFEVRSSFIFNTFHNVVSAAQNIAEHYPPRLLLSLILSKDKTTAARSKAAAEVSKCPTLLPVRLVVPGAQMVTTALAQCTPCKKKKKRNQNGSVQWETAALFLQSSVLSLIVNGRCWARRKQRNQYRSSKAHH